MRLRACALSTEGGERRIDVIEFMRIAKAAEACAEAGNPKKAVEVIMDVESLMSDANTLLDGATLLKRCWKSEPPDCQ
jgi:hypothetical protein